MVDMTLQELLKDFSLPPEFSSIATQSAHVTAHSGRVRPGSVFVALKGASLDGHQFIPEAIKKGARVVVAETLPALRPKEVFFISTPDSLSAFSQLCAHFFQYPLKKLQLIGITGTNGKTTTTFLIQHLLN
jgi:UDP-N-acetylmuramoyl-L-alanyl-D-glutamate--2,6-diaminopimelate ligase